LTYVTPVLIKKLPAVFARVAPKQSFGAPSSESQDAPSRQDIRLIYEGRRMPAKQELRVFNLPPKAEACRIELRFGTPALMEVLTPMAEQAVTARALQPLGGNGECTWGSGPAGRPAVGGGGWLAGCKPPAGVCSRAGARAHA
jgi:hypothetical protein